MLVKLHRFMGQGWDPKMKDRECSAFLHFAALHTASCDQAALLPSDDDLVIAQSLTITYMWV
jgi:hypothetical protein